MEQQRRTVVVGLDGSPHAETALRFAVEEAALRGAQVRAVTALEPPEIWAFAAGIDPVPDSDVIRAERRDQASVEVERVRERLPEHLRAVPIAVEAVAGRAAPVLVEAARDADLLVVGHRGRGGLRSTLLGSVGLGCVLHATGPVVVVPPSPGQEATEPADASGTAAARA
ncbi:universal stress protein [Actinomycetospora cinnamomea]|uniref:Nucleotide-binding universal stress UspA family protein n=1 Tax=Actinomycetospora cinnamomea TaxID=663609 RepID=A0A2U1F2H7_9PSEU|nr:universal stress protein [Actinomycetospora cinnamomea]PVZ06385.1 nucleotide-binding universal stress UspA family protein [Actinomycetospora cinnamomea]